ncbi:RING-type domain-containing protein [Mycena kentingensis (nom. inval.)]|nr:RING-type domain-containing protein [Mycena kentingensis (nom. inval.)]
MPVAQAFRQGVVQSITSHRILIYSLVSLLAVVATIANALTTQTNFFSIAIYLSKSSRSILVLANFSFLVALFGAHVVQKIFFGALRPSEVERLYDRLWFFITESLLAFTIFRDEFDIAFVVMFGFLLFVKSFHWIAADRVEWMDQRPYPGPPLLFHVRMITLFLVLWTTDLLLFMIAVDSIITNGVGGMVLFAALDQIRQVLEKNKYKQPVDAYNDVSLVFWNAIYYNEESSQITRDATILKAMLQNESKARNLPPGRESFWPKSAQKKYAVAPAPDEDEEDEPSSSADLPIYAPTPIFAAVIASGTTAEVKPTVAATAPVSAGGRLGHGGRGYSSRTSE